VIHIREKLLNELLTQLDFEGVEQYKLPLIKNRFDKVLGKYDVSASSTEIVKSLGLPAEIRHYIVAKKIDGLAESTLKMYLMRLDRFFTDTGIHSVADVQPNHIRMWLYTYQDASGISDRTLDGIRCILSGFFRWCVDEGHISSNPMRNIKKIKYETKAQSRLTMEELEELRSVCDTTRDRALVEFLYSTGVRCSELTTVKVQDVDIHGMKVSVRNQKSKRMKTVFLSQTCAFWVKRLMEERSDANDYLFQSAKNGHHQMTKSGVEHAVKMLAAKTSIEKKVTPTTFRRTMATHALNNGCDIVDVQIMLDHRKPKTTLIYAERYSDNVQMAHDRAIA